MKFRMNLRRILLAVLIFASLVAAATPAQATGGYILATTDIYTRQDEDFTTKLYITEGADICDFQISLNYNTELLTLVSAKSLVGSSATVNTRTTGLIQIAYSSGNNVTARTEVVELVFHVDPNAGIGAYDCLTVNTGYKAEASRLDNATGAFEDVAVTTDFASLVLYEMGDVNLDQSVTVRDVSLLKRHLSYLPTTPELTAFHLRIADAERDDKVNMRDVARIMRRCAYYTDDIYGDRINIYFYDADGNQYAVKSVLFGGDLTKLPAVPVRENYEGGQWSASPDSYVEPVLTSIEKELKLYAIYGEYQSDAITYYKQILQDTYYGGDLSTGLTGDLMLMTAMDYQGGYHAKITWQSSSNYIMNSTTGRFTVPTYPTELILTAKIVSYDSNNIIEATDSISFVYQVPGLFAVPTKSEITAWIERFFLDADGKYRVNYNLMLPQKLTDEDISSTAGNYEVRINWKYLDENGNELPLTQIQRTTSTQDMNLIAVITFNGFPLEGDGRIYLDHVEITAIDQIEIKNHLIEKIASHVPMAMTEGTRLWNEDTVYDTTIQWTSTKLDIQDNVVTMDHSLLDGSLVPMTAVVSYVSNGKQESFELSYTVSVKTSNQLLEPGVNIDKYLFYAIRERLSEVNGHTGNLTTHALRAQEFVSLDLSKYPDADKIRSLKGLSYCTNLHALNISGLRLADDSINEIASLSKLEALIAKDCDLENLSSGGQPVLKNAVNLKLLDLSGNKFTSLDSVFDENVTYGCLREVYLADNQLKDISALNSAPTITFLSLAGNGLKTENIQSLAKFDYLAYLSLADNELTNIDALTNLTSLIELRLQNNQIANISALRKMTGMRALYLSNNGIKSGASYLERLTELEVLYLNGNNITDISGLAELTHLKAINVSDNPELNDMSALSGCKNTIEEIYAENNSITSFNFIEGMTKLRVLMLSGNAPEDATTNTFLTGQLSTLTNLEVLTLSDKPLLDLDFLAYMPKLVRLDIANCGLTAYTASGASNIDSIVNRYMTLKVLNISNNNFSGHETELVALRNLSNLVIFYADCVGQSVDIYALVNEMPQLRYISMESCGVSDLSWMAKKHNLVFVDLAGSNISNVDLSMQTSESGRTVLEYLYIDANTNATFADFNKAGIDNSLKKLSLENIHLESISYLPDMNQLTWLNLKDTGLTSLEGEDPNYYDIYTIARFKALKTLDLSELELELAPVLELKELQTLYAVNDPESRMFFRSNLHTLQQLYNKGVTCYLYDDATEYVPVAQREGTEILNLLPDISCQIKVAADGKISDNNPVLPTVINDYDITWTVSNNTNYQIVNNQLAVKSYTNIDDEELTLTASIRPYDDQETVTRSFRIDTRILRVSADTRAKYCRIDSTGLESEFQRGDTFTYDVTVVAAQTDGFAQPVKPVVDEIAYTYSSALSSGASTPYVNVLSDQGSHRYTILGSAPLNSTTTITVKIGHRINNSLVIDDTMSVKFAVRARTYTITYSTDGGTVKDSNGQTVTSQKKSEEAVLFKDITVSRTGYLFEGWYSDSALTKLYWKSGNADVKMPANNVTVYAKWKANSFTLYFNANGGSVSETSRTVLCGQPFGTLPTPTRTGFDFLGWFTSDGKQVTASTTMTTATDVTVSAKWSAKAYPATWSGGTGYTITVQRTSSPNKGAPIETLTSGETVYYGDVLKITYTRSDYYRITSHGKTDITVTGDVTSKDIYATAELNPLSGWVRASEAPSGARIDERKWSYTLREYTESSSSSLSGYTLYETRRTGWGATQGPVYSDPSNGARNVWSETYETGRTHYWHYYRYANSSGSAGSDKQTSTYNRYESIDLNYQLTEKGSMGNYSQGYKWYYNGTNYRTMWLEYEWDDVQYGTRWYYQEPVYTYYYYRDVNKESSTNPSGQSNVSNVVEWVRYRAK